MEIFDRLIYEMREETKLKQTIRFHTGKTVCLTYFHFLEQTLAVFTLETDYPSVG